MTPPGFHTVTLGCKLNQFDTAAIEGELARRGYVPVADAAEAAVVVVNTCTVTAKADAEARRLVRGIRRANAGCRLLVTGCYAERDAAALSRIPGVDRVFGNFEKSALPGILDDLGVAALPVAPVAGATAAGDRGCDAAIDAVPALHFGERSRAFLKVQEGCDLACSYCVIPRVRGPSRSVPPDAVERAFRSLLDAGFREVVLTGVNTGDYGKDLEPPIDLATLLRRLFAVCGPNRVRLNSLEPRTVTDEIIEMMRAEPRFAAHLQVPLQSGSESVLRRMRRNYRTTLYRERLERLRARVPHVGLGADVIVGFPGESDAEFEETLRFVAGSPLNYLHVFAWSARPGTPASDLGGAPDGRVVRERSRRLRELGTELGRRFRATLVGRVLDAIVLGERDADDRRLRALTGNFVEVTLPAGSAARGVRVDVRIEREMDGVVPATVVGPTASP